MNESSKEIEMGFTKGFFPEHGDICLIYENDEQRRRIVSEYMAAGIRQGELVRYFADSTTPEKIRSWLLEIGVALPEAEQNGAFTISRAESVYCRRRVRTQVMIDGTEHRYGQAKEAGYSGVRSCGEMTWVFRGIPGSDRWLEYEALLNTVTAKLSPYGDVPIRRPLTETRC